MSQTTKEVEKLNYRQDVGERNDNHKDGSTTQKRNTRNRQTTLRRQKGEVTDNNNSVARTTSREKGEVKGTSRRNSTNRQTNERSQKGSAKDISQSSGQTVSAEKSESAGTSQQESETVRALTSRSTGNTRTQERVNIGCKVEFTVKIRGGLPLTNTNC